MPIFSIQKMLQIVALWAIAALCQSVWAQSGAVQVQWLGQSAMKITTPGGKVIVIDPWLIANPKKAHPNSKNSKRWAK